VSRERFLKTCGMALETALERERLAQLTGGGFLLLDARGLRATAAGRQRLNAVLGMLLG